MGAETPVKATNVVQNLEEGRIAVIQGVYERVSLSSETSSETATTIDW
jgi:hypothetical protein